MTSNQIAWWNIQENIRSHMQNELNERNKNSITSSLGEESNRISNQKMENDFVLGQQGNAINQQQADTAIRRTTQDYDIGLKNVANASTANQNQAIRNKQDYEIGTVSNKNKAQEVANNYVIGTVSNKNQSIRNAQDYALGQMQQESNRRQADAAVLKAGVALSDQNPAQILVALAAPGLQDAADATTKKVKEVVKQVTTQTKSAANQKSSTPPKDQPKIVTLQSISRKAPSTPSTPAKPKVSTTKKAQKPVPNSKKGRY